MPVKHSHNNSGTRVFAALMPVMAAVLVGFIIIGVALPVLPLHVKRDWGRMILLKRPHLRGAFIVRFLLYDFSQYHYMV